MRTDERTAKRGDAASRARRAYASPRLRCFGAVGALTQAGTGVNSELNPMNGKCNGSMNQQRC